MKHFNYILINKRRKTKIILEYSYQFRKKANRVVFLESTANLFENLRNFLALLINLISFISTIKNKKKKSRKKTTIKKLLKKVTKKIKISGNLKKTQSAL